MEFVLADGLTADTAPSPISTKVSLADIPPSTLAVRSFPGLATDGEVQRQRTALEDALLAEGIEYDNLSFKVAQYNPPYTLPWLRKNEITLKISTDEKMKAFDEDIVDVVSVDVDKGDEKEGDFETSPEAGD